MVPDSPLRRPTARLHGSALALMALCAWLGWRGGGWPLLSGALVVSAGLLGLIYRQYRQALQVAAEDREAAQTLGTELRLAQAAQASLTSDLGMLGSYGNLLLDSVDLAEALQISQQMLSRLLPDCAASIYPLIDGEGLGEATHLWGAHVGDTRPQASAHDCKAVESRRPHLAGSQCPEEYCAHVLPAADGVPMTTACIPLDVQTESLGWLYLSAPGEGPFPKLQVAVAAAEQLSQALANLKLRESLRDLSVRDPLTGLFNRRYLSESLGREVARSARRKMPLTVMMMDLDHFKAFNDNYGHAAGDAVLVAFARLLHNNFRSEDIACRLGGEEFVMIMPEMERAIAVRRGEELLKSTAALQIVHEGQVLPQVTISIGLALFPDSSDNPDKLMQDADKALYRAKSQGRNQVCVAASDD